MRNSRRGAIPAPNLLTIVITVKELVGRQNPQLGALEVQFLEGNEGEEIVLEDLTEPKLYSSLACFDSDFLAALAENKRLRLVFSNRIVQLHQS